MNKSAKIKQTLGVHREETERVAALKKLLDTAVKKVIEDIKGDLQSSKVLSEDVEKIIDKIAGQASFNDYPQL